MPAIRYFAYGSNMSLRRLRQRTPGARRVGSGSLPGHALRCHKVGHDGSGKCDAFETRDRGDAVLGALFEIPLQEKPLLDQAEGLGRGYEQKNVRLVASSGASIHAITYYATRIDARLKPYSWYLHHVLVGARESSLGQDYIARIEALGCIEDPDRERDARERAIYR